ncbi:MAG: hypothetical protein OEZ22_11310 [Spirochaetia bacterium]|nr:hypothetical protein [Spirochaetia bacterium]
MGYLDILTKKAVKEVKKHRTRIQGKKVVTDNISKLKSLSIKPTIEEKDEINNYIEPVTIEYYIPKESRFAHEIKLLYIELYDPQPKNENHKKIFNYFSKINEPIDVIKVMDIFPQFMVSILNYYTSKIGMYETSSKAFQEGMRDNPTEIRKALYLMEVLHKTEPTMPALEILGDYTTFNINWCIRFLNKNKIQHSLEDETVNYLIQRYRENCRKHNILIDERFEILSEIYLEQAYPKTAEDMLAESEQDILNEIA